MKINAEDTRGLAFAIYGKAKVLAANGKYKEAENYMYSP